MKKYRSCAGAVLRQKSNSSFILIGKRFGASNSWQFPQGGVENGESVKDAAGREASEEFGIPSENLQFVKQLINPMKYDTPSNSWLGKQGIAGQEITFFLFDTDWDISKCNVNVSHDEGVRQEFSEVKWMDLLQWDNELQPFVVDFKKPIYTELKISLTKALSS